ncbi:MAG TPA: putative FMN-dependent luciferase-like monooxygenase [Rhodopila sp.]|uniref:putative FMN-dependent luciferase-like monooxygenase n=1 Tax=Rhodopila sp. TaxID=2480087 RepID=UPI002C74C624|nr:putative FMN-dependent luciferase-like monooxygenase [Rhodopila sp.]HVY15553.1 putative FMN-dependent luciferase-like monooxygenase [Rhodopila sp.]
MSSTPRFQRLAFFTRLLDAAPAAERYRLATEQIAHAEAQGYDAAWVAQHHFHEHEGGLPSPFVFLAHVAARTGRIRLGTGIVTLPLELPVRVAEDAIVLDLLADGRLELGVGNGGNPSAFAGFELDGVDRNDLFVRNLARLRTALGGGKIPGGDTLYPQAPDLARRIWQATFSVSGGARAGAAGDGLMLSRTQPRPDDAPHASLAEIQDPIVDAYLAALPKHQAPRIVGSRSVFVADSRADARRFAETGLRTQAERFQAKGYTLKGGTLDDLIEAFDVHLGTPEDVIASLRADKTLHRCTDLAVQVHSVDPPHPWILRSIELVAQHVAPAFGWHRSPSAVAAAA